MSASRETVYAALFALLNGLAGGATPLLKDCSRRLKSLEDCQPENLPAAYQVQDDQDFSKPSTSIPPVMEWKAEWMVYGFSADPNVAPSTVLNQLVDAAVAQLTPLANGDTQTLGGLVADVSVKGTIQVFEGLLGDRCVAIIPITIKVPGF